MQRRVGTQEGRLEGRTPLMKFRTITTAVAAAAIALSVPASAGGNKTIVDLAVANENLSTLVDLVGAAELGGALSAEGPYTVLAPLNSAFGELDPATVEYLLSDEGKPLLTTILTYHVIPGDFKSGNLIALANRNGSSVEVETLAGEMLTLSVRKGKLRITDGAGNMHHVVKKNINASNGTVHVIDGVLLPE